MESTGTIRREMLETPVLPGQMFYTIYLPPCYSPDDEYPTLYLLHGLTYKDDQWIKLGIAEAADSLIETGEIQPLIIVMPYNPNYNRAPDSNFGTAFAEALVPFIDQQYSTCTDPECRSIGGLSRGGGWAFDIFLMYPKLFGAVGGHSPAIFQHVPDLFMEKMLAAWSGQRIWIDVGDKDKERDYLMIIDAALTEAEIPHEFVPGNGEHDEAYWQRHVAEYLRWYAGEFE